MKVCFVPTYNPNYARIQVFKKGLKLNDVELIDCSSKLKSPLKYLDIFFKFLRYKSKSDIILVGFFGQPLMPLIKLFTRKKIVFDAFISSYNTLVEDKKTVKKDSIKSKFLFWLDSYSCKLADIVILDTTEHINYFCNTFKLKKEKFRRVFIGADEDYFNLRKKKKENDKFKVEFHGKFIPLQGTEYIIRAAKLLEKEEIEFIMIGNGQTFDKDFLLAKRINVNNINFLGFQPLKVIAEEISTSDVCLGVLGKSNKAGYVIPNKAYEVLAMGKPLIVADSEASKELLKHKESAYFCERANPQAIAEAILDLKNNPKLKEKIGNNGYKIFKEKCSMKVIGEQLKEILKNTLNSK